MGRALRGDRIGGGDGVFGLGKEAMVGLLTNDDKGMPVLGIDVSPDPEILGISDQGLGASARPSFQ